MARPTDSNSAMLSRVLRPVALPNSTSPRSTARDQSKMPFSIAATKSPASFWQALTLSQTMLSARRMTWLSISALLSQFEPTAQTSAALGQPGAVEHRLAAGRGRDDDRQILGGLLWPVDAADFDLQPLGHAGRKIVALRLVAAVDVGDLDRPGADDGGQLAFGLPAGAEQAQVGGIAVGHGLDGHAGGGPGAQLAEPVGLDQCDQRALSVVKTDVKPRAARVVVYCFQPTVPK